MFRETQFSRIIQQEHVIPGYDENCFIFSKPFRCCANTVFVQRPDLDHPIGLQYCLFELTIAQKSVTLNRTEPIAIFEIP